MAGGPEGRGGDQRGLHQAARRILRVVQRAAQDDSFLRRQRVENLILLLGLQRLQNRDGVVAFEVAHALDEGFDRQFLENVLAGGLADLHQRGEVEVRAHQFDKARARFMAERFDQRAKVGFVQIPDERMDFRRVAERNSGLNLEHEVGVWSTAILVEMIRDGRFFFLIRRHRRIRAIKAFGSYPACARMQTGKTVMKSFSRPLRFVFVTLALVAGVSAARADCGPEALGVSRTLTISRTRATAVGLQTYPRTLDLADHEVVLTFDDGPAASTPKVLDALAKECAKATFFIIGHNAEAMPHLVKRAAAEGHAIGHHSWSHPDHTLRLMDEAKAKADIEKGIVATTKAAGGVSAPFFRFPGFADTPALVADLNARGYTVFGSDVWASDWKEMTPKAELDLILSRLDKIGRGIVLFHDNKAQTAGMLGEFLRELKKRGYRLVHLVPGDGDTPVVAAGPEWTSTTEPIIAKTLAPKKPAVKKPATEKPAVSGEHAPPAVESE